MDAEASVTPKPADPSFQEALEESKQLLSRLQHFYDEAAKRLAEQEAELAGSRARAEELETELKNSQQVGLQQAAERRALSAERERLQQTDAELRAALGSVESELKTTQEGRDQLRKVYEELKSTYATETSAAQRGLKAAFQEMGRLQDELERTRASLKQVQQERVQAEEQLQASGANLRSDLMALSAELETLREARVGLTRDKTKLEAEVARLKQQLETAGQKLERLQAAGNALHTERQRLVDERNVLNSKVKTLETELQTREELSQAENRKIREQLSALIAERDRLVRDRETVAAQQSRVTQDLQQVRAQLATEKDQHVSQVAALKQQLKAAQEELQPLRSAAAALVREKEKLQGELARVSEDLGTLQDAQLEWAIDRESLLKQHNASAGRLSDLQQEFDKTRNSLLSEKEALKRQVVELQNDLVSARGALESTDSQKEDLKRQVVELRDELVNARRALESMESVREENRRQLLEWENLEKDRQQIEKQRAALQARVEALDRDLRLKEDAFAGEQATWKQQLEEAKASHRTATEDNVMLRAQQETLTARLNEQEEEWRTRELRLTAKVKEFEEAHEREKAAIQAELEKASEAAARFRLVYERGHELYSTLNTIIGFSDILLDEQGNRATPEETKEFIEQINESGKRLLKSIAELIDLAKQEVGIIEERPAELLRTTRPLGSSSPIILVADPDPGVKERIQILSRAGYELVFAKNAQEAQKTAVQLHPIAILIDPKLPPKGSSELILDLKRDPRTRDIPVVLTSRVDKEQLGLDAGEVEFLTKPIDRQQLVQMMVKFDILADNKHTRKGPSTVLLVDDDPQNIRLMKAMLKPFNMEMLVAEGGKSGIEQALKKKPDLVILDLMMPDVDGFEVVSTLRQDPVGSQIPILIYTAKTITKEDRERLQGNIQSIVQKGDFSRDRILEVLKQLPPASKAS